MRMPSSLLLLLTAAAASVAAVELSGYEYIVVGAGAGGGPLAARLAMAGRRTLLLEAGTDQDDNVNTTVPAYSIRASEDRALAWDFFVRHHADERQQARDPKTTYRTADGGLYTGARPPPGAVMLGTLYPRASALGGCTTHNALITVTPHRSDWDGIARLTGDSSWASDHMRGYFRRLKREKPLLQPLLPQQPAVVDGGGWIPIETPQLTNLLPDPQSLSIILGGAFAMGNRTGVTPSIVSVLAGDPNEDSERRDRDGGYYQTPLSSGGGRRVSSRDFVVAVRDARKADGSRRFPLDVRTNCHVTRVLFSSNEDDKTPRATGVEFLDGPHLYRASRLSGGSGTPGSATASREVIVAAGAFNTPQLLKLSGVGPATELSRFNIPIVHDSPGVGANLQDHYEVGLQGVAPADFNAARGCTFADDEADDVCLRRWNNPVPLTGDRGPYSSNGVPVSMMIRTKGASEYDIYTFGGPFDFAGYYPGYSLDGVARRDVWSWVVLKAHPRNAAGSVTLRSADPLDVPDIVFNSFANGAGQDLPAMREGISVARDAFRRQLVHMREKMPGSEVQSAAALDSYIKDTVWGHHAASTCAIGPDGDPMAVLDSRFRVRGVRGLRVVDASVFPRIPGTFPALSTYMVAEKAADVILGEGGGE
ncbi:hypothetical protein L249_7866 [Ophiocordyceps polyrhachis-furcata BCC 54312]|uniref:Glucose-methanol-choline oxidoreductase N-terminal domain-containing protein n=1 Tax=Ophiocordyceps polyrhachis-furcata BCC 54312 TaxID=1330021 RepID=A0A367L0V1_9HYPO|nr:hypothetical protein L249_7866 [Ophiocordyceps polyrhachis-furcata BCC 54312]